MNNILEGMEVTPETLINQMFTKLYLALCCERIVNH